MGGGGNRSPRTVPGPRRERPELTCARVIAEAAALFGVAPEDLCGRDLDGRVIAARQAAMYVCRVVADEPLPAIGRSFGDRDDATVLQAVRRIDRMLTERSALHVKVLELADRVGGPLAARPGRVRRRTSG